MAGVPCGIVTAAEMKSASIFGKKWNDAHPPMIMPTVTISIAAPTAAVEYRQRSASSSAGRYTP